MECYKARWFLWASLSVIGVILFVMGIPVGILFLLFLSKKKSTLEYPTTECTNSENISPAEIQSNVRKTNAYFRNRVAFGRYVVLRVICSYPSHVTQFLLAPFSVYLQYDTDCWWFEFACTMRKLTLTGALVVFGAGSAPQIVFALAVCILWLNLVRYGYRFLFVVALSSSVNFSYVN